MQNVKLFITGLPGSGKSTVVAKVIEKLRLKGLTVGGIITPELRIEGRRAAFKVVDIASGREETLASISSLSGPRVGRYTVNVEAFERVALPALDYTLASCDVTCIDELGRMEFFSKRFIQKVDKIIHSEKHLLAVVHRDYVESYRKFGIMIQITTENRDLIINRITTHILGKKA